MEEKKIQIMDLLSYAIGIPEMKYFNFYKVLEDLPEDDMWD